MNETRAQSLRLRRVRDQPRVSVVESMNEVKEIIEIFLGCSFIFSLH